MVKTLIINFQPAYYINQGLIPNLRKRKNRSAIINIASGTGIHLSHNVGVYGTIKCFFDLYSRTLSL
jgi:short-subunit dehydrogenase involved in D-alanine esterification of teichoic acids